VRLLTYTDMFCCCCCCSRDTLIINFISFFTSIYAGVAVFAIIGYMAVEYKVPVNCVINSGQWCAHVIMIT